MSINFFSFYFLLCVNFISACTERTEDSEVKQKEISDPYTKSFLGKDVKFMLKENPFGSYDTVTFDESGNMVELQRLGGTFIKAQFDKNHFMIRHRIGGDLSEHNLISYQTNDNILVQKWVRIMTYEWDYKPEDINQLKTFYSVFVFDERNRLLKEVNLKEEFIINYEYADGILVKRDKYDLRVGMLSVTWKYFYEKGSVKRIEEYYYRDHQNVPDIIHYFNDGRLDSTQRISPKNEVDHTEKYTYINVHENK